MPATPIPSRSRRVLVLLAAASSLIPMSLNSQDRPSPELPSLVQGPYAVGYAVRQELDHSRAFKKRFDYFGERTKGEIARPIQITIWYPPEKGAGTPMRLSDYFDVMATEADFSQRTPEELRGFRDDREQILMMEWRVVPDSMGAVKSRLDALL